MISASSDYPWHMTTISIPPITLAMLCAGDLLNPRLPIVGAPGPLPSDWIATNEVPPVGTHRHMSHIGRQWVLERNLVDPSQVDPQCPAVWAWRCEHGHVWVEQLNGRNFSRNCPRCADQQPSRDRAWVPPEKAITNVPVTPNFPTHTELRAALEAKEGKTNERIEWQCHAAWRHPHKPYIRSLNEILFHGSGCPECWKREHFMPPASITPGDAFYSYIDHPGSPQETKLKRALMRYLPVDGTVNAVRIADDFFGKPMVHPDVLCPSIKLAIEYDGQVDNHLRASEREKDSVKDELMREAGWEVIRVCAPKVRPLNAHDVVVGAGDSIPAIAQRVSEVASRLRPVVPA